MSRHFKNHKPRTVISDNSRGSSIFDMSCSVNQPHAHTHQQPKHTKPNFSIDPFSDSLNIQNTNCTMAQSFINMSGFDDLSPFITQSHDPRTAVSSMRDNNFNDYNETGPNNINDSDYRQRMIRQMQRSVFEQSNAMFAHSEKVATPSRPINENTYDASGSYSPSAAPSLYLQQQSKSLFKNINKDDN